MNPGLLKKETANFAKVDDDFMQLDAVKEDNIDSDMSLKLGQNSLNSGFPGSESGAGTLVGDNMALGDDPFNGRHNNMFGHLIGEEQPHVKAGRQTVNLDQLMDKGDFKQLNDDITESNRGSMVSAIFGTMGANAVKTPGFNPEKKFSFACNADDGNGSENDVIMNVQDTSLEQSDVDDISSMASDFPKFRAKRAKKRSSSFS